MEKTIRYKYRIYPNTTQKAHIHRSIGTSRWWWNQLLSIQIEQYKKDKTFIWGYSLNPVIMNLKKEYPWTYETSSNIAIYQRDTITKALKSRFKSGKGFPRFHKKKNGMGTYSVSTPNRIRLSDDNKKLMLPKLGWVKINLHRPLPNKPRTTTIIREGHRYYASICVKIDIPELIEEVNEDHIVGVDLGLKSFAVTSDGQIFETVKPFRKKQRRLAIKQRAVSRKVANSGKRRKTQQKVRELHRKIRNTRTNIHWDIANKITKNNDLICLETLNVKGLARTKKAKSIYDAGWGLFVERIKWIAEKQGKCVVQIGRFEPSTRTCNRCGRKKDMPLELRTYECECGYVEDRDVNASYNIRDMGLKIYRRAGGKLRPTGYDYISPRVPGNDQVGKYTKFDNDVKLCV